MDAAADVSDSTDWLQTSTPLLAPFESSLRCQVCKDLFDTPMITSCAHTFCSLCIQRCLSSDGRCPACREQDQTSKLRKNWVVQNIVDLFQEARTQVLDMSRECKALKEELAEKNSATSTIGRRKRKWRDVGEGNESHGSQKSARQTRSQTKRPAEPIGSQDLLTDGNESDADYAPEVAHPGATEEVNDGLVQCPMCSMRMKEEAMWSHLDKCDGTQPKKRNESRPTPPQTKHPSRPPSQPQNIARLPQPNFALLKDGPLKRRIAELGIPAWGDRQLLMKRYIEWINLYNSNADSSRPRSTRELLKELDIWERSQGGKASQKEHRARDKDFDGSAWARENKDQFSDLIAQARAKRKTLAKTDNADDVDDRSQEKRSSHGPNSSLETAAQELTPRHSVIVRQPSDHLTASADTVMTEAVEGAPTQDGIAALPSRAESLQREGLSISPHQQHPVGRPSSASRCSPFMLGPTRQSPQPPQTPLKKAPMFTLPEAGFTDGDGIETSGQ